MADEGHNRALYVTGLIKDSEFKRALVDTGASKNIITMKTLKAAKFPQNKIVLHPILMTGFEGSQIHTYGYAYIDLKVGPIQSKTKFHVIEQEPDYHMILGQPWLYDNKVVPSTYHQCMKALLNNKIVRIAASASPYAPVYDAEFLESQQDIPEPPNKIHSTPLPIWKSIEEEVTDKPSSSDVKSIKSSATPIKRRKGQVSTPRSNFITSHDAEGRTI
ncbi:uncharacterized protein LOC113359796 [Papaver somniferum]|uniref:uncharacterized protein LOC113359796 n=1 Tax=Papaver somniferum TaxID=3469 RepID=UPI000E6F6BD4|nr:uncharacterized protein LOC113359796 [Papaver somniferum]